MLELDTIPLLEFDPDREAVIDPARLIPVREDVSEHGVVCFFKDVIDGLAATGEAAEVDRLRTEMGGHPFYKLIYNGQALTLFHPGVGAPLAAGLLEELIAMGCRKIVACGGAGVLDSEIAVGHVVIPNAAVRDEGVSYHYLPPSREVAADPESVAVLERVLKRRGVPYVVGKTWTTDGFYRETPGKVALRRTEGCITVEMEVAAFFAVTQFRGVRFGQLLYGGDDVSGAEWDHREWQRASIREHLLWLAAEACLEL